MDVNWIKLVGCIIRRFAVFTTSNLYAKRGYNYGLGYVVIGCFLILSCSIITPDYQVQSVLRCNYVTINHIKLILLKKLVLAVAHF